jgi:Lar family restriction alleviation protein
VTQPAPELEPCPFCGGENVTTYLDSEQGDKWGYAGCDRCDARGPEVRTNYEREHDAPWHSEAILKWNTRADATQTAVAAALKMAAQTARLTMTIQKGADELTCTLCAEEVRKLISLPAEAALEAYVAERVAEALAEQTAGPLSAKVENLERSIRFALAAGMTELNLGNYDHDQVCDLQNEAIEIHSILTAALERNAATPTPTPRRNPSSRWRGPLPRRLAVGVDAPLERRHFWRMERGTVFGGREDGGVAARVPPCAAS